MNRDTIALAKELRHYATIFESCATLLDGHLPARPKRRTQSEHGPKHLSKAARRKISLAMKRRWALVRGGKSLPRKKAA